MKTEMYFLQVCSWRCLESWLTRCPVKTNPMTTGDILSLHTTQKAYELPSVYLAKTL